MPAMAPPAGGRAPEAAARPGEAPPTEALRTTANEKADSEAMPQRHRARPVADLNEGGEREDQDKGCAEQLHDDLLGKSVSTEAKLALCTAQHRRIPRHCPWLDAGSGT